VSTTVDVSILRHVQKIGEFIAWVYIKEVRASEPGGVVPF